MSKTWRERLKAAVEADSRSARRISLEAGLGPNFLQQLFKDGKEPGFDKLSAVLGILGSSATLYVAAGIRLTPQAETFLRLALSLDDAQKSVIESAISQIEGAPSETIPLPVAAGASEASDPKD